MRTAAGPHELDAVAQLLIAGDAAAIGMSSVPATAAPGIATIASSTAGSNIPRLSAAAICWAISPPLRLCPRALPMPRWSFLSP
eukprot:1789351-Pyramimonas_sp.AAC.1